MDQRIEIKAGRPPKEQAEALGDHVVAVADALFIQHGYGATSMATVAARARVGKQTLYRRFPDKAALFREVVRRRLNVMVLATDGSGECDPMAALKEIGRKALEIVLDPEFLRLYRIVIAEALPFPELAAAAAGHWGSGCVDICVDAIREAQARGLCRPGDPTTFAQTYLWGVVGEPFLKGLSGENQTGRDHHARLEQVWSVFLEGVLPKSP